MARYINVDELLVKIHDEYTISYFKPTKEDMQLIGILEIINAQPTADVVEVKHGVWQKKGNEKKCSLCKFIYYSNNDEWTFCPNCGAKMDGKDIKMSLPNKEVK